MLYIKKLFFILCFVVAPCCSAMQNVFIDYITGFNGPVDIAITPNGNYGYVIDGGSNSLLVIDTRESSPTFNTLISAPNLSGIFNNPADLAITPDSNFAYVCDYNSGSLFMIDTNPLSSTFNSIISTPYLTGAFSSPNSIAITPDGLRAYVTNAGNNNVSLVDIDPTSPTYNTVLMTPNLDSILNNPFQIVITPDGNFAYVSNLGNNVSVIDTNPSSSTYNTLLTTPGLAFVNNQPEGLAITANGLFAYVSDGASTDVSVIDINPTSPTFNTVLNTPNLSSAFNYPNGVATTADGNYAYVSNYIGSNGSISSISVIDTNPSHTTFNSTLNTPGLNLPPSITTRFVSLAATPNAKFVYAVDSYNNTVDVIYTGIIAAPLNFFGCKTKNIFLTQTDFINRLTWSAPIIGNPPAVYGIYRDAGLTQSVAKVLATSPLQYDDHSRNPNVNYTYYIVSVDALGNISASATTMVTQSC